METYCSIDIYSDLVVAMATKAVKTRDRKKGQKAAEAISSEGEPLENCYRIRSEQAIIFILKWKRTDLQISIRI